MTPDFGDTLRNGAARFAARTAVWCDGAEQTYAGLLDRACRLSNALTALGASKGDRVALLSANGPHTVEQIAGIALGGHVRAGLYAHQTGAINGYLLELVGARVLIVQAGLWTDELRAALPACVEHVVVDGDAAAGMLAYEELVAGASASDPQVRCAPGDVHVIRFSAGTTGRPKGIFHTNCWRPTSTRGRGCARSGGELTRARVGSIEKVTSVDVVDALPKSGVGKVLRREVRERYWSATHPTGPGERRVGTA